MQTEVFEAFRAIHIPEEKALKAGGALSKRDDVASLKTDTSVLKWMMGFVLAFQWAIFGKLFALTKSAEFGRKRRMFRARAPLPKHQAGTILCCMKIEFDAAKDEASQAKHGFSLAAAAEIDLDGRDLSRRM